MPRPRWHRSRASTTPVISCRRPRKDWASTQLGAGYLLPSSEHALPYSLRRPVPLPTYVPTRQRLVASVGAVALLTGIPLQALAMASMGTTVHTSLQIGRWTTPSPSARACVALARRPPTRPKELLARASQCTFMTILRPPRMQLTGPSFAASGAAHRASRRTRPWWRQGATRSQARARRAMVSRGQRAALRSNLARALST